MRRGNGRGYVLPLLLMAGLAACGGTVRDEPVSEAPAQVAQAADGSGRPTGALRWAQLLTGPDDNSGTLARDRDGGFLARVNFIGRIDLGEGPVLAQGARPAPRWRSRATTSRDACGG
ncbi:hypothetical protein D187_002658 [Cystobacter fuscus DSM 2262]|uniref:Lipoprotein n=1 Tax=Cystobacter fuscus (strain ATCC 25194 / DSM 2262 / NBRC 100088 / M29) TaxID=1242864 RepID=S9QF05_CYSF2|nr:hypothetical protein [Cystobacter fuscus]EPX59914.1 hypothetical protein D187_002658 [Cystobacter fuscus DSM 2262]